MQRLALLLACAIAAAAPTAYAQSGWYAGLSAGQSRTDRELVRNRETTVTLATDFRSDFDDRDRAFKVTFGYRIWPSLALEVSYADLGTHRVHSAFLGGDPPAPASITLVREVAGVGADAVFLAPIGLAGGAVFGRAGALRSRLKASAELDGNVVFTNGDPLERRRSTVRDETVGHAGLGLQWPLARNAWARLEWERYFKIGKAFEVGGTGTTGEADTDTLTAGVVFSFR
jgi:opacity protein-like surface antigen